MMRIKDFKSSAIALYDGGWRKEDKEYLIEEYDLYEEDAERICELLEELWEEEMEYKYILMDERGDIFTEYFKTAEEAIDAGESKLYLMTKYEKERCDGFYVLETVNPDKGAEDHFDGSVIKRWI